MKGIKSKVTLLQEGGEGRGDYMEYGITGERVSLRVLGGESFGERKPEGVENSVLLISRGEKKGGKVAKL